jgi:hypothetical protein
VKLVKTHSFINPDGAASIVLPVELKALLQLEAWAFRLFAGLVKLADFKTGKGQCNYPSLLAWMTAPKNESGGQQPTTYSRNQVVRMLRSMEAVGLLDLDRNASQAEGVVFFQVRARDWKSALGDRRERGGERPQSRQNPDEHRAKSTQGGQSRTGWRTGIQSSSKTLSSIKEGDVDNLSTAFGGTQELAPLGGQNIGPNGPRPPPEALTGSGEGHGVGSHQGPPRGRSDAPAGHAPQRPRNDTWVRGMNTGRFPDATEWETDENGAVIVPEGHGLGAKRSTARTGPRKAAWS